MLDASLSLSSPFRIDFVDLNGVSSDGRQVITLGLYLNAEVSFEVGVRIGALQPEAKEWEKIMDYGISQRKQSFSQSNPIEPNENLPDTDLNATFSPSAVIKSAGGSPVLKPRSVHSRSFAHIFRRDANVLYHSTESVRPALQTSRPPELHETRRKTSLLDTAASLATRPAWTSHDGLQAVRLSRTTSADESVEYNIPECASQLNLDDPRKFKRELLSPIRSASFHGPQVAWPTEPSSGEDGSHSSQSSEGPAVEQPTFETDVDSCFMRPVDAASRTVFDVSYVPLHKKAGSELWILKPGLNEIQLVANHDGFFIPKRLFLSDVGRRSSSDFGGKFERLTDALPMCYDVRAADFSATWKDPYLLDCLLPKIRLPCCEESSPTPVVLGLRQSVPFRLESGKLTRSVNGTSSVTLYRVIKNVDQNTLSSQTKVKLGSSDYTIKPPVEQKADSESPQLLTYPYDYQDGPVSVQLSQRENEETNKDSVSTKPQCWTDVEQQLCVTPVYDMDEFVLSMPCGNLCRFPVRVVRPLVIMLNIHTIHSSDAVLFSIRVACADIPELPYLSKGSSSLTPTKPLTFRLSKFHFMVNAPTVQDNFSSPSRKGSVAAVSVPSVPTSLVSSRRGSYMQMNTAEIQQPNLSDCMFAIPVDPCCNVVEVNRLCPVNLLFRVKFSEFRPFIKTLLKRFGQSPVARFCCSFGLADDPDYEAQLTFCRAISPVRQRVPEKNPGSINNPLTRTRKEQRIGS